MLASLTSNVSISALTYHDRSCNAEFDIALCDEAVLFCGSVASTKIFSALNCVFADNIMAPNKILRPSAICHTTNPKAFLIYPQTDRTPLQHIFSCPSTKSNGPKTVLRPSPHATNSQQQKLPLPRTHLIAPNKKPCAPFRKHNHLHNSYGPTNKSM